MLDLWRDDLLAVPTDEKVALALELERATRAGDPRIRGVESASYGDAAVEAAVANSLGVEAVGPPDGELVRVVALAGEGRRDADRLWLLGGADVRRRRRRGRPRATPPSEPPACSARPSPRSRRLAVILDPLVTRSLLGSSGAALSGEAVLKGRSMFVGREGEEVAAPGVTLVDDPTIADAFGAAAHDGEGVPTRRTALVDGGVLRGFLHNVYTGRRSARAHDGLRGARLQVDARRRCPGARTSLPGPVTRRRSSRRHRRGALRAVGQRPALGDEPGERRLLRRCRGTDGADGAFAEPVREITIASTLPRMLLDVAEIGTDLTWLPGGAAGVTLVLGEMTLSD